MPTPSRRELANAIRFLAADAVEAAKSGHPGMPMGMADIAEVVWNDFLRHNPNNPKWFDRDRFVLSNGHGSMLQYALLHLSGYDLPIEELKNFRQLHSKTAGHPEASETPGVETTTGPLGQGLANAVGIALAEKLLAQRFNRPDFNIVDHHTWVFLGDGCLMEGISHEACSLAGTWGLGKLIALWDDNHISIDGDTAGWFTDDTPARFESYGWQVIRGVNGHDPVEIAQAIRTAQAETARPTLICCRTTIGFGAPNKQGKESAHGAPLGKDELALARETLGWTHAPFEIPVRDLRRLARRQHRPGARGSSGTSCSTRYASAHPELAAELLRRAQGELPEDFGARAEAYIAKLQADGPVVASRKASQMALEAFAPLLPELIGGSADLAHSNLTLWKGSTSVAGKDPDANYIYYGVREFGMSAISNGLALHGGFLPYDATFLVFSRLRAQRTAHVGADPGARHPRVHPRLDRPRRRRPDAPAGRAPGLAALHPQQRRLAALRRGRVRGRLAATRSSAATVRAAWSSRGQNLAHQARDTAQLADIACGGYVLHRARWRFRCDPDRHRLGSGAGDAGGDGAGGGRRRVRAWCPCPATNTFDRQPAEWREQVLPRAVRKRVAVEAGVTDFWRKYVGLDGAVIGIDSFGASAPIDALYTHFGITAEAVVAAARGLLAAD